MASPVGMNNFVRFEVKNHANLKVPGTIMNANLVWGKWQVNGNDVPTVSNKEFTDTQPALFTAMGRESSPSGTEGNFEIFIEGKMIANVFFDVPFAGSNKFSITSTSQEYMCSESGFSASGSPSITITCYKLA